MPLWACVPLWNELSPNIRYFDILAELIPAARVAWKQPTAAHPSPHDTMGRQRTAHETAHETAHDTAAGRSISAGASWKSAGMQLEQRSSLRLSQQYVGMGIS